MTGPAAESGERDLPTRADTVALGEELAALVGAGDVIVLDGPLGAGKTALTAGIASGLGVRGRVTSPTFVLARRHAPEAPGRPGLVHVDAYRLLGEAVGPGGVPGSEAVPSPVALADELESLDLDTALATDVVVVEWGAGLAETLSEAPLVVRMDRFPDTEVRHARWARVRRDADYGGGPGAGPR